MSDALAPALRAKFDALRALYPPEMKTSLVLPLLHCVQDEQGYVTEADAGRIAGGSVTLGGDDKIREETLKLDEPRASVAEAEGRVVVASATISAATSPTERKAAEKSLASETKKLNKEREKLTKVEAAFSAFVRAQLAIDHRL
mgnify:CR=1 FL=1